MIFESFFYNMRKFWNYKFHLGSCVVDLKGSIVDQIGHWNTGNDSSEISWVTFNPLYKNQFTTPSTIAYSAHSFWMKSKG